jgi:AraC-like DNA-binding protein
MYMAAEKRHADRSEASCGFHLTANEDLKADVSIGKFIRDVYMKSGFKVESWYKDYGVSSDQFNCAGGRFPHEVSSIIWDRVESESRDQHIGLHLAETTSFPTNHLLYYLTSCSDTLRLALVQLEKYCQLLSDACKITLVIEGRQARLTIDLHHMSIPATGQQLDFWLMVFTRHMASLVSSRFAPICVRFKHEKSDSSGEYGRLFNCRTTFGQAENAIVFPTDVLDWPIASGNPAVFEMLTVQADAQLSRLRNTSIVDRVRREFTAQLNDGICLDKDINRVASNITIHPRTLQRQLAAEGTSYSQMLDKYKKEVTLAKISNADRSIADIAPRLGYADTSAFHRAFKRWTGVTPGQYRQRIKFDQDSRHLV